MDDYMDKENRIESPVIEFYKEVAGMELPYGNILEYQRNVVRGVDKCRDKLKEMGYNPDDYTIEIFHPRQSAKTFPPAKLVAVPKGVSIVDKKERKILL